MPSMTLDDVVDITEEKKPSQAELLAQQIKKTFSKSKTPLLPCALSAATLHSPKHIR